MKFCFSVLDISTFTCSLLPSENYELSYSQWQEYLQQAVQDDHRMEELVPAIMASRRLDRRDLDSTQLYTMQWFAKCDNHKTDITAIVTSFNEQTVSFIE